MDPQTNIHLNAIGVGNKDSFNVTNSYNNTVNPCPDEKPQILKWLSPLEPRVRHQDVRTSRADGVGEWFLRSEEFVNWRNGKGESDGAILFCSGAPGVGKTYLSSLVVDELCDGCVRQKDAVACFYCDFQDQKTQTPENILGALVKQLIRGSGAIPTEIDDAFQKAKDRIGGRGLLVRELLPLLQAALAPLDRAFICIDALDECAGKHLPELLRSLHTISQWSPRIRLFITGRPHIQREIEKRFSGGAQFAEIKPTTEDIMKYLQMMLDNDPEPEAMNPDLKAEIMKQVSGTISDVFLLVSLNITAILAEATVYRRRKQLKRMTSGLGLGDAYCVALDRLGAQMGAKARLGMATLMWISRSERPMTIDELCHALGVEIGFTDLNPESIPPIQTLLASCLGLVTVDKTGSTVRLVHFTLQEYLDSHSEIFLNPYATMAEICLTYLNYDCVKKLSPTLDSALPTTPFLEYASTYWGLYARNETTERVKSLALPLLLNFETHISAKLLLHPHVWQLGFKPTNQPKGFTGLHCVAYLGINEIANALLQIEGKGINRADFLGRTPLIWAAKEGHEEMITLFLKCGDIDLNAKDAEWGRTALSWAAAGGYERIVKLLLVQEAVDVESRDKSGRTPLSYAAQSRNEAVVNLFLEREEVNVESRNNFGRTPLSYAAQSGNEGVMKLFLGREEVNPESQNNSGRTPLSYAAEHWNEGTVKLLLEREEVNAESQDDYGRSPLSYAAQSSHVRVLRMFLDPDEPNVELRVSSSAVPLSYAAEHGNEGTLKLLLEREEVNAESLDNHGRTPLSHAARSENEEAVKLFLEREEVNAESRDNSGRTPLSYAAESKNKRVAKLFLDVEEVNAESRDNGGRTPLSYAAEHGSEGTLKLLLEREEVNAGSRDNGGRTPFSYASRSGNEGVIKFLEWYQVNVESQDSDCRTPLS